VEWFLVLLVLALLVFVVRKAVDPETARGLKRLLKVGAAAIGLLFLLAIVSFATR